VVGALTVINICLLMMKEVDYIHPLTREIQAHITVMAVFGAVVGQLLFGVMSDRVRKRQKLVPRPSSLVPLRFDRHQERKWLAVVGEGAIDKEGLLVVDESAGSSL